MAEVDYCIIGAGIIGTSLVRCLSEKGFERICLVEKEKTPGEHTSGRNSGVIHSGINQTPGTLKSRFCVEGNRLLREYCTARGVPMEMCGTLVIARDKHEERVLYTLYGMGLENKVPGLRIIDHSELCDREPEVQGYKALFSPTGSIVDSGALVKSIAEDASANGVSFMFNSEVTSITPDNTVITDKGDKIKSRYVINAAGLYADNIARLMDVENPCRIIPFRGDYHSVSGLAINSMVYQVPDFDFPFLGVHLTKTLGGPVLAGPSAVLSLGRESYNREINFGESWEMLLSPHFRRMVLKPEFLRLGMHNLSLALSSKRFAKEISSLTKKSIGADAIQGWRSGIRPQLVTPRGALLEDLVIEKTPRSLHILNSISPGLTCSMAFAQHLVDNVIPKPVNL
jgi:L-2-hydroxyglutarate oxidase